MARVLKVPERVAFAQPDAELAVPEYGRRYQVSGCDRVSAPTPPHPHAHTRGETGPDDNPWTTASVRASPTRGKTFTSEAELRRKQCQERLERFT